ncbi:hypothetical protein RN001_002261 [Aquatica leii]|uniref:Uncharacterized protein n=1 Tax=Aquatica leii TaxID=1421715 RepID=A0AAN7SST2_9COLE|nr:hypothetical protein RN001_002261 [Aquatica leii]
MINSEASYENYNDCDSRSNVNCSSDVDNNINVIFNLDNGNEKPIYLDVIINGKKHAMQLDTGSAISAVIAANKLFQ